MRVLINVIAKSRYVLVHQFLVVVEDMQAVLDLHIPIEFLERLICVRVAN